MLRCCVCVKNVACRCFIQADGVVIGGLRVVFCDCSRCKVVCIGICLSRVRASHRIAICRVISRICARLGCVCASHSVGIGCVVRCIGICLSRVRTSHRIAICRVIRCIGACFSCIGAPNRIGIGRIVRSVGIGLGCIGASNRIAICRVVARIRACLGCIGASHGVCIGRVVARIRACLRRVRASHSVVVGCPNLSIALLSVEVRGKVVVVLCSLLHRKGGYLPPVQMIVPGTIEVERMRGDVLENNRTGAFPYSRQMPVKRQPRVGNRRCELQGQVALRVLDFHN